MMISKGVAYGVFRGYSICMDEGAGYKTVVFSTKFVDEANYGRFCQMLDQKNMQKEYRITNQNWTKDYIAFVFYDTIGTMKRIRAFLDWFIPVLDACNATKANICAQCGSPVTEGKWIQVDGCCHFVHAACAQYVKDQILANNEQKHDTMTGSYATGAMGAFLGATVGAVVWALVLMMGYVASLVGFVIGWLGQFGYNLCKGKQGKGKLVILIFAIVFGVALGTLVADGFALAEMINNGEGVWLTYGDIPAYLLYLIQNDTEYVSAIVENGLLGLLFAALGVFGLLRKSAQSVADQKYIEL